MTAVVLTPPADRTRTCSPCPSRLTGSSSFIIRSRIQAPVALNSRLLLPLRRASATIFSARGRRSASKFWKVSAELLPVLHQPAEPHRILQRERGALAGMRAGGVRGVADQQRALARPGRQGRDVERVGDHDVLGGVDDARDRIVPAGMEIAQMLLQRCLAHGAKRRRVDAMRGLRAPPHHAVVRIGAAKAVAEKAALPERRLDALADRRVRRARDRGTKPPKPIRPVSNGFGPSGITCVRTAECTPSAPIRKSPSARGAVGEMRDDRLVGAILDARPGASRNAARRSRTRPCRSASRSAWRGTCSPRAGRNAASCCG